MLIYLPLCASCVVDWLADGFIAMPGGLGTFEEFFEVINWSQPKLYDKPYGLLNICNYFDKLIELLDHIASEGFLNPIHKGNIYINDNPGELISNIAQHHNSPDQLQPAASAVR